jgi:hypothetical protein
VSIEITDIGSFEKAIAYKMSECESNIKKAFTDGVIQNLDIKFDVSTGLWIINATSPVDFSAPSVSKNLEWAIYDQLRVAKEIFEDT